MSRCLPILLVALSGLGACASADSHDLIGCEGGKCDDLGALSSHARAVSGCTGRHELSQQDASDSSALAKSENEYRDCLAAANDSVAPDLAALLDERSAQYSSEYVIASFSDYRYSTLCTDVAAAVKSEGADQSRCERERELGLSYLIGGLIDLDGRGFEGTFVEPRNILPECYASFDEGVVVAKTPEDESLLRKELEACAVEQLFTLADDLFTEQCQDGSCPDELLIQAYLSAGVATAVDTSDDVCELLAQAGGKGSSDLSTCKVRSYADLLQAALVLLDDQQAPLNEGLFVGPLFVAII